MGRVIPGRPFSVVKQLFAANNSRATHPSKSATATIMRSSLSTTKTETMKNTVAEVHLAASDSAAPFDQQELMIQHFRRFYETQTPVVFRNAVQGTTPATLDQWQNLDYLTQRVGPDYVCDVEMGSYNSGGERLSIPFEQYMVYLKLWKEQYESSSSNKNNSNGSGNQDERPPILYLAQNDLPPGLLDDIQLPAPCTDSSIGAGKLYQTMFWVGPSGTISPLHQDPLNNFLMQIVGRKRVCLLTNQVDKQALYTGAEWGQQPNTSAVEDVEQPDFTRFPLFETVHSQVLTTILQPRDMLYIPSKWWHTARSLDLSISVNSWWR